MSRPHDDLIASYRGGTEAQEATMNTTTTAAIAALTEKGQATMLAIGTHSVSFFDGGVAEGEGTWGGVIADELGHRSSGVLNGLVKQGLLENNGNDEDNKSAGDWYVLTALGADVALTLAGQDEAVAVAAEAAAPAADEAAVTMKVCGKWTRFYADGVEVGRFLNGFQADVARLTQG